MAYSGTVVMMDSLSRGVGSSISSIVESSTIGESKKNCLFKVKVEKYSDFRLFAKIKDMLLFIFQ